MTSCFYLRCGFRSCLVQQNQDFEQRVWWCLAVSIDGSGQLLHGLLDVAPQSFLYHAVYLLYVIYPVLLDLKIEIPKISHHFISNLGCICQIDWTLVINMSHAVYHWAQLMPYNQSPYKLAALLFHLSIIRWHYTYTRMTEKRDTDLRSIAREVSVDANHGINNTLMCRAHGLKLSLLVGSLVPLKLQVSNKSNKGCTQNYNRK